jgi:hypothetical protein
MNTTYLFKTVTSKRPRAKYSVYKYQPATYERAEYMNEDGLIINLDPSAHRLSFVSIESKMSAGKGEAEYRILHRSVEKVLLDKVFKTTDTEDESLTDALQRLAESVPASTKSVSDGFFAWLEYDAGVFRLNTREEVFYLAEEGFNKPTLTGTADDSIVAAELVKFIERYRAINSDYLDDEYFFMPAGDIESTVSRFLSYLAELRFFLASATGRKLSCQALRKILRKRVVATQTFVDHLLHKLYQPSDHPPAVDVLISSFLKAHQMIAGLYFSQCEDAAEFRSTVTAAYKLLKSTKSTHSATLESLKHKLQEISISNKLGTVNSTIRPILQACEQKLKAISIRELGEVELLDLKNSISRVAELQINKQITSYGLSNSSFYYVYDGKTSRRKEFPVDHRGQYFKTANYSVYTQQDSNILSYVKNGSSQLDDCRLQSKETIKAVRSTFSDRLFILSQGETLGDDEQPSIDLFFVDLALLEKEGALNPVRVITPEPLNSSFQIWDDIILTDQSEEGCKVKLFEMVEMDEGPTLFRIANSAISCNKDDPLSIENLNIPVEFVPHQGKLIVRSHQIVNGAMHEHLTSYTKREVQGMIKIEREQSISLGELPAQVPLSPVWIIKKQSLGYLSIASHCRTVGLVLYKAGKFSATLRIPVASRRWKTASITGCLASTYFDRILIAGQILGEQSYYEQMILQLKLYNIRF